MALRASEIDVETARAYLSSKGTVVRRTADLCQCALEHSMSSLFNTDLEQLRFSFPVTEQAIYLDHAAIGPISRNVAKAIQEQSKLHSENLINASVIYADRGSEARQSIARLVGSRADRIAFVQNTSHGMSLIANGQPWKNGDNVVVPAMDFPSNFLPWKRLESLGVEMRCVSVPDGRVTLNAIADAMDDRTRVVALSAVQYYNGYRVDLAAIAAAARRCDALLVVDGTQAVGAMQIDVDASGIDALVVSSHKWMLGPPGIGFMALSDRALERTEVTQLGWLSVSDPFEFRRKIELPNDATRFEAGTENFSGLFGLSARLSEIASFGATNIEKRVLHLTSCLAEDLQGLGFEMGSPMGQHERSSILTFRHSVLKPEAVVPEMRAAGIYVSARNGFVRASPHYYNSEEELAALVEWLKDAAI